MIPLSSQPNPMTPEPQMQRNEIIYKTLKTRIRYYVPILKWLLSYDVKKDLLNDALAGITVALLIIPQSLSYASGLAKLEPIFGLYTCFFPALIYGILGTSRQLSVGPEALVSLLTGNAIHSTSGPNSTMEEHISIATTLCLIVGIFTFALGLTRMGFIDSVLSRALLRGFVTAVACVIAIEQCPQLLGLPPFEPPNNGGGKPHEEPYESPFSKLVVVLQNLEHANVATSLISLGSITFLLGYQKLKSFLISKLSLPHSSASRSPFALHDDPEPHISYESFPVDAGRHSSEDSLLEHEYTRLPWQIRIFFYIPDILIVVVCTIIITYCSNLSETHGVEILGKAALDGGFRLPHPPKLTSGRLKNLLTPAILISILGFVESIVGAKNYSGKYNYPVSANRELVAFGITSNWVPLILGSLNLVGSLFNCFPAFASIARSQVNDAAGARTQMSVLITGLLVLLTIVFILPIFYYLPKAVMASIVFVAAMALLEFEDIVFMWKIRAWTDLGLMSMTYLITIFWSVEAGTLISIAFSLVMVVKHSTAPKISVLGKIVEGAGGEGSSSNQATVKVTKVKYRPLNEIFQNREEHLVSQDDMDILIFKVEEGLFFANSGQLKDRIRRAEAYGGWMHIHPGEEEARRVAPSAPLKNSSEIPKEKDLSSPTNHRRKFLGRFLDKIRSDDEKNDGEILDEGLPDDAALMLTDTYDLPLIRAVIFDIDNMNHIDASAIQTLIEITHEYQSRGIEVCFVKLREKNKQMFLRSGLLGEILGSDHFFRKIGDAIKFLHEKWNNDTVDPGVTGTSYSTYNVL